MSRLKARKANAGKPSGAADLAEERWPTRILVLILVVLTLFMTLTQDPYHLLLYCSFLFAAVGVSGLNLSMGTAGLVSVGSAAFLCVGSFVAVVGDRAGLPMWLSVVLGILAAAILGALFALPSARLAALYFALSTLAAQVIVIDLAQNYQRSKVGDAGFLTVPTFSERGILGKQQAWAWLLTVVLAVVLVAISRLRRGRAGRAWRLLREHELAAAAVGVRVARWRISAMVISSAVIGGEGALNFYFSGTSSTSQFTLLISIQFVAMLLIGGIDTIWGPVLGAATVVMLPIWSKNAVSALGGTDFASQHGGQVSQAIYGLLVMVALVLARDGLNGLARSAWAGVRRRTLAMSGQNPRANTD